MRRLHLLAAILLVTACEREYHGPDMQEPGVVQTLIYNPARHGAGTGVGISTGGDVVVTSTSIQVEPSWGVVFRCRHGNFVIEGSDDKYRSLWSKFAVGDSVNIRYQEVYVQPETGHRIIVRYDFQDAWPR